MRTYSSVEFDPFAQQEIDKVCLTTESQREIWLACILGGDPASLAYNQCMTMNFHGHLNKEVFEQAIYELTNQHESLRSSFSRNGKQLIIYKEVEPDFTDHDLSLKSPSQQQEFIKENIQRETNTAFDIENGPLIRYNLFRLTPEHHVFSFTTHHIIADGWSLGIIIEELSFIYTRLLGGSPKRLTSETFQISGYTEELKRFRETEEYYKNLLYWQNKYEKDIPERPIKNDFPGPEIRSYKGNSVTVPLPKGLADKLKETAIKANVSLVTLLISAFEIQVAKTSKQSKFVVGLFSSGRTEMHHGRLIGHCVTLLPLLAEVIPGVTYRSYLQTRKSYLFDAIEHQQFTLNELIKALPIQRIGTQVPLVPMVFNIDAPLGTEASFPDLSFDYDLAERASETFDINLNVVWGRGVDELRCAYNVDLYKEQHIKEFLEEYVQTLQEFCSNLDTKITVDTPLLIDWDAINRRNNTQVPLPENDTLLTYFKKMVDSYPQHPAIRFHQTEMSYASLAVQSNQLANHLMQQGIQPGDAVGIALDRSPLMIVAMLAVLKCGAAYIPLDPGFPHERILYMLENSDAKVLITAQKYKQHFACKAKELIVEDFLLEINQFSEVAPEVYFPSDNLAYILYTSGSTGKPKGVQISHKSLLNFLLSTQKEPGISHEDKWLAITTISFDIAVMEIFLPLISGATLLLADEGTVRDGAEILRLIKNENVTIFQATPATYNMMLYEEWEEKLPIKVLCGGEAFPKVLAEKLLVRTQEVWNMYGPTETTIWSTLKKLSLEDEIITVGHPMDNTLIYILDEQLQMVPEGSPGEIYIAGKGLARGYINRPDLTQEKFIPNPFQPEIAPQIYGTGDIGIALPNGEIQCLGRLDHQIKIRGFRIELGEIEYALSKINGIKEAVVVAREDVPGDKRICAYLILQAALPTPEEEQPLKVNFRRELKERLPNYMIPNDFVFLTRFPLTPNGKIDRKLLPPPGEQSEFQEVKSFENKPLTELGVTVSKTWENILNVSSSQLADDFFEQGGHSLIAVQLLSQLEKSLGLRIPVTTLFKASRLGDFIDAVETLVLQKESNVLEESAEKKESQKIKSLESNLQNDEILVPTTNGQKEIWIASLLASDLGKSSFNLPFVFHLSGKLNTEAFVSSLTDLVNRHESLRAKFSESGESMIIQPHMELPFYWLDLTMLSKQEQETTVKEYLNEKVKTPFDFVNEPLIRFYLHQLSPTEHYFTILVHHIICDGISLNVLYKELFKLYNAKAKNQPVQLEEAPQFSDFALDELTYFNSQSYHKTQEYWLEKFQNKIPVTTLPADFPRRPGSHSYACEQLTFSLKDKTFKDLQQLTKDQKCSMVPLILSFFELVLLNETRQKELIVAVPVSGQTGTFIDLVGNTVNVLPFKSTHSPTLRFKEYLQQRVNQLYKDYEHSRLALGELFRKMKIKHDPLRPTMFPVLFSMRTNDSLKLNGLEIKEINHPMSAQAYELSLYVNQNPDELELVWVYSKDLFKAERIERLQANLMSIITQTCDSAAVQIKDLFKDGTEAQENYSSSSITDSPEADSFKMVSPRNQTETMIAEIWSEHLNIPVVNMKSNFFDLGGHSMTAVRIMMDIQKKIGKRLPLSALFSYPTIEELAQKIHSETTEEWKSLVPIRTQGTKVPLYIVHGKGMNVLAFGSLIDSLDSDQPLYGLQPKGLNPEEHANSSIEEIAKGYVEELLKHNPEGPYAIAGYSSGGTVALEMSEQLINLNKKVAFLGLIDTYYTGKSFTTLLKEGKPGEAFGNFFKFISYGFVCFAKYPKAFLRHKFSFIFGTLYNNYKKLNPNKVDLANPMHVVDQVQKVHDLAFAKYKIKEYQADVTLFKGNQKVLTYVPNVSTNGFSPYIKGNLKVVDVPIEHMKFFEPEFASVFGEKIQEALNTQLS